MDAGATLRVECTDDFHDEDVANVITAFERVDTRDPECVKNWPECYSFGYDPRCCRFPKSCSA